LSRSSPLNRRGEDPEARARKVTHFVAMLERGETIHG
jgi:hypothetical protein